MFKKISLTSSLILVTTSITVSSAVTFIKIENNQKAPKKYTNLFAIGDSLIDSGALVNAGTLFINGNFMVKNLLQINKITLNSPYYQNRSFSNGPTTAELLAHKLNVSFKVGWDFETGFISKTNYQQVGTNYAFGGAQITDYSFPNSYFLDNFSFENQINALIKQHKLSQQDLIYINIGNNDILGQKDWSFKKIDPLTTKMADKVQVMTEKLINNGAKNIVISGLTDFGITPRFFKTQNQKNISEAASIYNQKIASKLNITKDRYSDVSLKIHDIYNDFHQLKSKFLNRGQEYKFTNATTIDFGDLTVKGNYHSQYVKDATLDNLDQYFFLDESHPTKWAHQEIATKLYQIVS